MRTFRFLGLDYLIGGSRSTLGPRVLAALDQLPRLLMRHAARSAGAPSLLDGWITVAKIDHLGDLLMATPLLQELRRQRPHLRIQLVVGSWSLPLARLLERQGLCEEVVTLDAITLNRSGGIVSRVATYYRTFRDAIRLVRRRRPVCFVDLRPFSPNALPLALLAGVPFRVGFGARGLSYVLHRVMPISPSGSLGQMFLSVLPLLGLDASRYDGPVPLPGGVDDAGSTAVPSDLPYLVLHAASPHASRQVPDDVWAVTLPILSRHRRIVAVGTATDAVRFGALSRFARDGAWIDLMGKTTFPELVAVVQRSQGGIVIDSLVAHLLLAGRLPTTILMTPGASCRNSFPDEAPSIDFVPIDEGPDRWHASAERLLARLPARPQPAERSA